MSTGKSLDYGTLSNEISKIRDILKTVALSVGQFNIIDESLIPYGLKPIARSMSWLIEQNHSSESKERLE